MLALRNRHFFLLDLALLPAAAVLAFALRLDATGMQPYAPTIIIFIAVSLPIKLIAFRCMGLYSRFWRYASVDELLLIAVATGVSSLVSAALLFGLVLPLADITGVLGSPGFPRSIPFIDWLLTLLVVAGPRFTVRLTEQSRQRKRRQSQQGPEKRVLIMGAGDAGVLIAKEMQANPQLGLVPVGFLDDDESKCGVRIHGVPVLGNREHIPELVHGHEVDEVIIAMPSAPGSAIREILGICSRAGMSARTMPGLYDILSGQVSVSQIREVDIEDLLRREPVQTDVQAISEYLHDARVLVTGAGGSIGSEVCRQVARYHPECLVLLGHGENSVYHIDLELRSTYPDLHTRAVIADIRDMHRVCKVMARFRPTVVFHAAAHKHVSLMEQNIAEAVTNNVFGTRNLIRAAEEQGVHRLVLISTDKAVNPVGAMGATKRITEMLVQDAAQRTRSGCAFVAVRFGNVLGSRGSVVPLFKQQIAAGGPITVTDPEMRRYFMTIPEAVQLVIQAAAMGRGGEVFILDMGEPVRIVDLATDLVELSGLQVGRDVDIVFTGVRPGEKLCEELFLDGDSHDSTTHEKIFVVRNALPVDGEQLARALAELEALTQDGNPALVIGKMREIVPEFRPASDL